jgi:hypothetical protein
MMEMHDEATEILPEPPVHARPSSSGGFQAALGSQADSSRPMTPFPVAPPEWLPRNDPDDPAPDDFNAFRNRVLLIAGISVAVILLLSFLLGN